MERVLAGLPGEVCSLYLDVITVNTLTLETELETARYSVCRPRVAGTKLDPKKWHVLKKQASFSG